MFRSKNAKKMIHYFESKFNCDNLQSNLDSIRENDRIVIQHIGVTYNTIEYRNQQEKDEIYQIFDFMTEANNIGFDCFPYLYGVLNCQDGESGTLNIFREEFDGPITELFEMVQGVSEWYDIIFQLIMIDYLIRVVNLLNFDGSIDNYYFTKLPKPYYQEYEIEGSKFLLNRKYLIVYFSTKPFSLAEEKTPSKMVDIEKYIKDHKIPVPPTTKIMSLINRVANGSGKIPDLLASFYQMKSN